MELLGMFNKLNDSKYYFALKNSTDNSRCVAACVAGIINAYKNKSVYKDPVQLDSFLFRERDIKENTIQAIAAYVLAKEGMQVIMNIPMPVSWAQIYTHGIDIMGIDAIQYLEKYFNMDNYHKAVKLAYDAGVVMKDDGYRDIKKIINNNNNSFIMAGVNPFVLYDEASKEIGGHYILIVGLNTKKDEILISDPGLPYHKETVISLSAFNLAWKGNYYSAGELIIAKKISVSDCTKA
ncbi:MAG: hypothetical protein ACKUBY_04010 [Candidatus Moraniibacteriota bacterium]|jgi:hypothetical protein